MYKDILEIAIMIPVYNGAKTLPKAVNSILSQTYKNWQCYIVNDGSTDGTKDYLDSIQDKRFIIHHLDKNMGRPYARQKILDLAQGDLLAFLDADDFYHPQKLELQVRAMQSNPRIDLVSCANASYDKVFKLHTIRGEGDGSIKMNQNIFPPPTALRTAMVDLSKAKTIGFNLKLQQSQDVDFMTRYLERYPQYTITKEILYYYSEFESVTLKKILRTRFYNILFFKDYMSAFQFSKSVVLEFLKIIFDLLYASFFGIEKLLKRRGRPVSEKEIQEFENVLSSLSNENKLT